MPPRDAQLSDADLGPDAGPPSDVGPVTYGRMIRVPAGPFWMGCYEGDGPPWCGENPDYPLCCHSYVQPFHRVQVPGFEIDQTEVTVEALRACVEAGACQQPWAAPPCTFGRTDIPNLPVICATASHAEQFCAWAGKRLCSEAEWEKAARGGCEHNGGDECATRMRNYPWGPELPTCERAIITEDEGGEDLRYGCGLGRPHPVGSRPTGASPYGVLDMLGNASEYVADCWHRTYEGAPTDGSPWLDACEGPSIVRGSDYTAGDEQTVSTRHTGFSFEDTCCGFRCCRSIE